MCGDGEIQGSGEADKLYVVYYERTCTMARIQAMRVCVCVCVWTVHTNTHAFDSENMGCMSQKKSKTQQICRFHAHYTVHKHGSELNRSSPAWTRYLLLAAGFVQIDHNVRVVDFHVARRIIECKVAVLSDTHKRDINRDSLEQLAQSHTLHLHRDEPDGVYERQEL